MTLLRRAIALALCLALVWAQAAQAITLEKEREIGREALEEVKEQIPLIHDPVVVDYIRDLGQRLERHLEGDPFEYKWYVADEPTMNAFALPGGWIFMFRGMITSMESEAELVGVMAHEISHVHYRHISDRIEKSGPLSAATMAGMLAGMVLGALAGAPALGQAVTMGSMAGGIQKQLAFSRQDEEEADYGAFKLVTEAGYPAAEMEKSFRRVWRMQRYTMPEMPRYLLTHPTSPERMEKLQNLVRRHPHPDASFDNQRFLQVRTRLMALYESEDRASRELRRMMSDGQDPGLGYYGMALLEMRRDRYDLALKYLDQLQGDWVSQAAVLRERGICRLRLGDFEKAQELLSRALASRPEDREAMAALGEAHLQAGEHEQARRVLERALEADPDSPEVRHQLGMALGKMGRTDEASLHLGLAFKARGNLRAAKYHLSRAAEELAGRPELQKQARKALDELEGKKPDQREPGLAGPGWRGGLGVTGPDGLERLQGGSAGQSGLTITGPDGRKRRLGGPAPYNP
jgi:predicted Zn-dependent protease